MRIWIAVWTGSSELCGRAGEWLRRGPGARLLGLLFAAGFIKGLPWTTGIAATAIVLWLTAAAALGLRMAPPDDHPEDEPEEAPALPDTDELAAALHEIGAPHAHLAVLADHLDLDTARVREALTEAGIPVSGGCRMKGRGVSTGVKADDFPPLPSPAPDAPTDVVAAGQDSNNNKVRRWDWGLTLFRGSEQPAEEVTAK